MADEITIQQVVRIVNGSFSDQQAISGTATQNGNGGGNPGVVDIPTTEVTVDFGDIATEGWAWIQNLDDTNWVKFGPESGGAGVWFGKLMPNEPPALVRLHPGMILRMEADTAECRCLVKVWED